MNTRPEPDRSEVLERMAETMWRAELRRATGRERNVPWSEISSIDQDRWRFLADAILSAGLVRDEAAIRADEREKCACKKDERK